MQKLIIMKAYNRGAKINKRLVFLEIRETFPQKCQVRPIPENFPSKITRYKVIIKLANY